MFQSSVNYFVSMNKIYWKRKSKMFTLKSLEYCEPFESKRVDSLTIHDSETYVHAWIVKPVMIVVVPVVKLSLSM